MNALTQALAVHQIELQHDERSEVPLRRPQQSSDDGPHRVELLKQSPKPLLQLLLGHAFRDVDTFVPAVTTPVFVKQSTVFLPSLKKRGPGRRGQDEEVGHRHLVRHKEIVSLLERLGRVPLHPHDHADVRGDPDP